MQKFASADGPREVNNHQGNHAVWLQYVERVRTWSTILGLMPEAETTLDRIQVAILVQTFFAEAGLFVLCRAIVDQRRPSEIIETPTNAWSVWIDPSLYSQWSA
ncbi:hypothetical protein PAAG_12130 [Paracoccidioides lutzii Pb01]|uniref:Uncharacterized protein n=1 Tax=Paracoccidioides lutzii (strain ATCC MYA-826 / Pb01) TaxID=502779 RepID=A0A0A2V505_PARBA|nr:hypothetical protein PAAG_12130 [Paracoccidioides lutzii Pb01]KGQ01185.1 hypothetical protein PAAG_12130 [Paracoccidioides lutzii Pb01]